MTGIEWEDKTSLPHSKVCSANFVHCVLSAKFVFGLNSNTKNALVLSVTKLMKWSLLTSVTRRLRAPRGAERRFWLLTTLQPSSYCFRGLCPPVNSAKRLQCREYVSTRTAPCKKEASPKGSQFPNIHKKASWWSFRRSNPDFDSMWVKWEQSLQTTVQLSRFQIPSAFLWTAFSRRQSWTQVLSTCDDHLKHLSQNKPGQNKIKILSSSIHTSSAKEAHTRKSIIIIETAQKLRAIWIALSLAITRQLQMLLHQ